MTIQIDRKGLMNLIKRENERIMDMLITFNVPETIEDTDMDNYLLEPSKKTLQNNLKQQGAADVLELEERLKTIKNKMRTKKSPISEKAQKRREAKKLKKNKEFKKVLVSAAKSIKSENIKQNNDSKKDIKPVVAKPVFNEEGKMVFSKFDFAAHPGSKIKKSHQNPKEILKKMKQTDKKIKELKEQGEIEKASELKTDIAWKKAFDKIEGKKVKDDPKLLYKSIKKRKDEKKKAKKNWTDRTKKVESDIDKRQKKRQENLDKRSKDKKNKKLKNLSKKGRVIPGF